jgi:hypothetical protein
MKFKELAWGAFIHRYGYSDTGTYQSLASDANFLARLKANPSLEDLERLRKFLVKYGVHYAPKDLAEQYLRIWPVLQPHVYQLSDEQLETCNFEQQEIQDEIKKAYNLLDLRAWGADTVVSKVLHFCNISFFVMWDFDIRDGVFGPQAYIDFLKMMQKEALEALEDFNRLGLPGRPEEFVSGRLNYKSIRPLTKLIDDYNWATTTKHWPKEVPDWLINLMIAK